MHVTYNDRGQQLSYDWPLQKKHPRKAPWEVILKIKRYGTGLTQRVSMEDGSSEYWAPVLGNVVAPKEAVFVAMFYLLLQK